MVSGRSFPQFTPKSVDDLNVVALAKGSERYVFIFEDQWALEILRRLGQYASDPELSFTCYDAACASQRVRALVQGRGMMGDE